MSEIGQFCCEIHRYNKNQKSKYSNTHLHRSTIIIILNNFALAYQLRVYAEILKVLRCYFNSKISKIPKRCFTQKQKLKLYNLYLIFTFLEKFIRLIKILVLCTKVSCTTDLQINNSAGSRTLMLVYGGLIPFLKSSSSGEVS